MKKNAGRACALIVGVALLGCAAPKAADPGPAAAPPSTGIPAAAALPSYPLIKDEPSIATATRELDAAGPEARPPLLLARVKVAIAEGQKIRAEQGTLISLPVAATGHERYLACYDLAYRDLQEIAVHHPKAAEAPEARYLLGLIHDYPHLDLFEDALVQYRLAVESYPGSPWARKAADRIELIEDIMGGAPESPHGK
ncbi:MAG: tetratricopeptide repeat protein [Candidatus Methylomirabilia bacterium]